MSMTIEEAIRHYEESERDNRIVAGICASPMAKNHSLENAEKCRQMIAWLRELQERRKADNKIPFGDSYSFTELDSIINAYEVHGSYYKEVVELLKELKERRERSKIAKTIGEQEGEWIPVHPIHSDDSGAYMCSKCKTGMWEIRPSSYHYCPFCGTKMKGAKDAAK